MSAQFFSSQAIFKPRVGVGIVVVQDGKVLLGKRVGSHGCGYYSPPGGNLEFKETVEACAIRELKEETGLNPLSIQIGPWTQNVIDEQNHYISLFVVVSEFEGIPERLEPQKCEGWYWYQWDELPSPLFPSFASFLQSNGVDVFFHPIKKT